MSTEESCSTPKERAFTLIELLVVVAIIALLISILFPALNAAKRRARLTQCLANLRNQGTAMQTYVADYASALPPKLSWVVRGANNDILLMNSILAAYLGQPMIKPDFGFAKPSGIFRCPDVAEGEEDEERWTHSGYLHHAPNRYLFNTTYYYVSQSRFIIQSDCAMDWELQFGRAERRRLERVHDPSVVIALADNVNFNVPNHYHREGRESLGASCEVISDPDTDMCGDNRGSHADLERRPALMADGHGEALPTTRKYWQDLPVYFRPNFGSPSGPTSFFEQEVRRFHWYLAPNEQVAGED